MTRPKQFFMLAILLLVAVVRADDPPAPPKTLELDKLLVDSMAAGATNRYVVPIAKTYSSGEWNFFVVVNPKRSQSWQRTEIKIYKLDDGGKESLAVKCSETGVDACLIGRNRLYDNDKVYIDVKCVDACEYDVKAYWSESFPLTLGKTVVLNFESDAYAKVFTLDLEGKEFEELRVILTAQSMLVWSSPIHLLANYGKVAPTVSQHDLKGVHLWDDGQGIFLKKTDLKEQFLTILVEGPAENILELKAELVTRHAHDISLFAPLFDYLRPLTARTYTIDLSNLSKVSNQDVVVKISVFTGSIETNFYSDEKLNTMLTSTEFGHMGDQQYKFGRDHLRNITDKLYLKVSCQSTESTFVVAAVLRQANKPIRLDTELAQLSEIYRHESDLFYVELRARSNQRIDQALHMQFVIHNFTGAATPVFHICRTNNVDDCGANLARTYKQPQDIRLLNYSESFNGRNSTLYGVDLNYSDFSNIPDQPRVKRLILVVLVWTNTDRVRYSITNINHVGVRTLRQNFPVRDRLALGEQKYYRVGRIASDVKSVVVRLTEVSGTTVIKGYRADPRGKELTLPSTNAVHDALVFKDNLTAQPIFLIANGQQNSLFVLSLTMQRQQKNDTSGRQFFNYIVVPENVLQELSIEPFESQFIQIHPSSEKFQLVLDSSLDVNYCATTAKHKRPLPPNCGIAIKEGANNLTHKGVMYIGITNGQNRRVIVKVSYTDSFNCESQMVGHVWRKKMEHDGAVGCVKYVLPSKDDIEIVVELASKKYDNMHVAVNFGRSGEVYVLEEPSIMFHRHELENICPQVGPCEATVIVSSIKDTDVEVLMQYLNKSVTLLDGIAQKIEGAYQTNTYKHFKFHLANKVPTTIIVESKVGYYSFFLSVLDEDNLDKLNLSKKYPTKEEHHFNSTNDYYTRYNTLYLSLDDLSRFNCTRCVMLISVALNTNDVETHGKYIIEATQQMRYLKEHSQAVGYLAKHSMALYEYYLPSGDRSMVISLSTENVDCAVLYLAQGVEKPASASHYIKKVHGNELVYKGDKGSYSIMVEAVQNCRYTISASSTGQRLYEMNNGVFRDLKLNAGQTVYFFYEHLVGSGFKIMSLDNYGELIIHANVTNSTHLENLDNETTTEGFSWTSSKDLLVVSETDRDFCNNCLYLIVVEALKDTETSLIISSIGTEIPLSTKRTLTDVLTEHHPTLYKIFDSSKELNISVEVHHGELSLQAISKDNNETRKFKPQNKSELWVFKQFKNTSESSILSEPVRLVARADRDTMYTIYVNSTENQIDRRRLKQGIPSYTFLSAGEEQCYDVSSSGAVRLILSVGDRDNDKLSSLKLRLKTAKDDVLPVLESVDGTMLVEFKGSLPLDNYTFCMQSKDILSMTVILVSRITLLPEASSFFVDREQNFSLTPNGKVILEVFECMGSTSVLFSNKFGDLSGDDSELLQWRRFGTNYLVETEHYGPVFLNVDGRSRVRWMHVDDTKGEGIGYYNIRTPHFSYKFHDNKTMFSIKPLVQTGRQKLNITAVNISLAMSDTHKRVKEALQCFSEVEVSRSSHLKGKSIEDMLDITIPNEDIDKAFEKSDKDNFFVGVRASVDLITPSGLTERYTFFYDTQEMPWRFSEAETAKKQPMPSTSSGFWSTLFTLVLVVLAAVVLLLLYRFVKVQLLKKKREKLLKEGNQSVQSAVNDVELKYASFGTSH